MSDLSPVVPLRASDVAYEQLREMILDLTLGPGEILNEASLAAKLNIGRMPVREAIGRLVSDRFVTVLPRRGTVVATMTMMDIANLYDAREAVECGIVRVAVRYITDEQIADFARLVDVADVARGRFDAERFLLDDLSVHRFVAGLVENSLLRGTAETLLLHNLRFWRTFFRSKLPQNDTMLSHRDLLLALERRDGAAAEEATRTHIDGARQLLVTVFGSSDA
ncbi:MAG TPA: GntR family transcriptional regulator [Acidimicrobiales bacterium]|jgi:DNA-binding GntR family transcriptional regulator|nr:GntR family transcriptional regulator [Acidimicrobiales bacterium]